MVCKNTRKTIIWHANTSDLVPQGSILNLDTQNGLILGDPQGTTLWTTDLVVGNIDYGFMNDTGNFVVMRSDSTDPLWESFKNPTDTLLPDQTLERGGFLVSQRSQANFTQGRFYLRMLDNGNLVLVTKRVPSNSVDDDEYYNSGTFDPTNITNSGDKLVFEENGVMYILKRNNQRKIPGSISSASQNYHRVSLNFDGFLSHYYHSRSSNSSGWDVFWSQPDNICVEATKEFKEELGRGAFGIVYKGVMTIGSRNLVAIKKMDRVSHDTQKEFMTEVNVISQTHHKNLVHLLGYCNEGPHRLLVYEYMSNDTLASFIYGDPKPNWSQRTKIAMGIAWGLSYLHEECSTQIIHCDIKPQNILLDDYRVARISDFGLSKLMMINQSRTFTNIRGTRGYVAPEWFRNSQVTVKVDVYSFGVLLLEIITYRKHYENEESYGLETILTNWVLDCFQEGKLEALVESDIEALNDKKQLERFVMVGIWCIQEDPLMRPTMRKVCQMLEGSVEVTIPPCPYDFSITI
ncbi:hypothetical protein RND71_007103 [Anisodus tanguticus]|uniref:non-specific serine/threonine protein kinase n=1 Tax=Anisodus tanguticus TaxID=243964 RepID=A0AAE1SL69_9SOLA|nr:hypothetical protein RND71_007103 [Anisodus tanguticus]